jgi:hypothetical protein
MIPDEFFWFMFFMILILFGDFIVRWLKETLIFIEAYYASRQRKNLSE